jgi:hypothetical protein
MKHQIGSLDNPTRLAVLCGRLLMQIGLASCMACTHCTPFDPRVVDAYLGRGSVADPEALGL